MTATHRQVQAELEYELTIEEISMEFVLQDDRKRRLRRTEKGFPPDSSEVHVDEEAARGTMRILLDEAGSRE